MEGDVNITVDLLYHTKPNLLDPNLRYTYHYAHNATRGSLMQLDKAPSVISNNEILAWNVEH